jgi:cytochrome c
MSYSIGRCSFAFLASMTLLACSNDQPERRIPSGAPLAERLAGAHPDYGRHLFYRCGACHNLTQGSGDRAGPNLWGVVGKPVATNSGRFGYTGALIAFGGTWTCERLDRWLTNPRKTVPGTTMTFEGLANGADRADVIAWLASNGGAEPDADCPTMPRSQ